MQIITFFIKMLLLLLGCAYAFSIENLSYETESNPRQSKPSLSDDDFNPFAPFSNEKMDVSESRMDKAEDVDRILSIFGGPMLRVRPNWGSGHRTRPHLGSKHHRKPHRKPHGFKKPHFGHIHYEDEYHNDQIFKDEFKGNDIHDEHHFSHHDSHNKGEVKFEDYSFKPSPPDSFENQFKIHESLEHFGMSPHHSVEYSSLNHDAHLHHDPIIHSHSHESKPHAESHVYQDFTGGHHDIPDFSVEHNPHESFFDIHGGGGHDEFNLILHEDGPPTKLPHSPGFVKGITKNSIYRGDVPFKEIVNEHDRIHPGLEPGGVKGLDPQLISFITDKTRPYVHRHLFNH